MLCLWKWLGERNAHLIHTLLRTHVNAPKDTFFWPLIFKQELSKSQSSIVCQPPSIHPFIRAILFCLPVHTSFILTFPSHCQWRGSVFIQCQGFVMPVTSQLQSHTRTSCLAWLGGDLVCQATPPLLCTFTQILGSEFKFVLTVHKWLFGLGLWFKI